MLAQMFLMPLQNATLYYDVYLSKVAFYPTLIVYVMYNTYWYVWISKNAFYVMPYNYAYSWNIIITQKYNFIFFCNIAW